MNEEPVEDSCFAISCLIGCTGMLVLTFWFVPLAVDGVADAVEDAVEVPVDVVEEPVEDLVGLLV